MKTRTPEDQIRDDVRQALDEGATVVRSGYTRKYYTRHQGVVGRWRLTRAELTYAFEKGRIE